MSKELSEEIHPGSPIKASVWEEIRRIAVRFSKFSVSYPLELVNTKGGMSLRMRDRSEEIWIKITSGGTSGKYAWTQQLPAADGTWTDGETTGTTTTLPAIEVNGNTSVPTNTRVLARMDPDRTTYRFVYSKCS